MSSSTMILSNHGKLESRLAERFSRWILLIIHVRLAGGVDGGERINVMQWFINKVRNEEFYQPIQDYMLRTNAKNKPQDTRIKDLEPKYFKFYYDQLVTDVEYNGRLDTINLPIFTCENDKPPEYPDAEGSGNGTLQIFL